MKQLIRFVLLVGILALSVGMVGAQDEGVDGEGANLYTTLLLIPDNQTSRNWVSYSDFTVLEELRPDLVALDLQTIADGGESLRDWLWNLPIQGLPQLRYMGRDPLGSHALSGVSIREITQAVHWGQAPTNGQALIGTFDVAAIDAALAASGFESAEINGRAAWCHVEGCDKGMNTEFSAIEPLNLFIGELGRFMPTVPSENVIFYSPNLAVVEGAVETLNSDGETSLGAARAYRAAAEVVSVVSAANDDARLRQAVFVPAELLIGIDPRVMLTPNAIMSEMPTIPMIPLSELVMVADFATLDAQMVTVMLVFANRELAEIAATAIPERLNLPSLRTGAPYSDLFVEREMIMSEPLIMETDDRAVLALSFAVPAPEEDGMIAIAFEFILNMLYARDVLWIAPL